MLSSTFVQPAPKAGAAGSLVQVENAARLRGTTAIGAVPQEESSYSQALPLLTGICGLGTMMQVANRRRRARAARGCRASLAAVATETHADGYDDEVEFETPVTGVVSRRGTLAGVAAMAGAASTGKAAQAAYTPDDTTWVQYDLNTGETLYDIDFDEDDPSHGFVCGARGLFYETKDGGKRWVSRSFANLSKGADISYRFQTVSVKGKEVWITGKPALLLHSKDGGATWKKVPVSRKLPGDPRLLIALAPGKAEMATSSGAVYTTENDGKNWKSVVKETVDATLNRTSASGVQGASYYTGSVKEIKRAANGRYLAVAQRGNFYLTYKPGEDRWIPHNRVSARRIQAMGFRDTANEDPWEGVWMSLNGGYFSNCTDPKYAEFGQESKDLFSASSIRTGGIGIIDCAFRTDQEAWAVGGSGVIYLTKDGGKSWGFDPAGNDLPCNLYNVKFFEGGKFGYMIGNNGILLRKEFKSGYKTPAPAAAAAPAAAPPAAAAPEAAPAAASGVSA